MSDLVSSVTNNTYKILKYMNSCEIILPDGTKCVPLSQVELSEFIGVSTITMNKLFKQMINEGLIISIEGRRGKYQLTDKAMIILKNIENMEIELREVE